MRPLPSFSVNALAPSEVQFLTSTLILLNIFSGFLTMPYDKVRELRGHSSKITAISVSPSGEWIASADEGGYIFVWATETGAIAATFEIDHKGETTAVSALLWLPMKQNQRSGRCVVVGCTTGLLAWFKDFQVRTVLPFVSC
jgi:WD40 repeat protein